MDYVIYWHYNKKYGHINVPIHGDRIQSLHNYLSFPNLKGICNLELNLEF